MNTRDTSLLGLLFPQGRGVPDQVWSKILLNPAVIPVLASFALDIVDVVKTQIRDSIGTLFQMSLLDVLVSGWKKYDEVSNALEKSRQTPNDTVLQSLANQTFKSVHHPYIALYKDGTPVGKIEFETTVALNVEGVQLKIQNGEITGILTGSCQGSLQLAMAGQVLSEAQTGPIALPGSIAVTPPARQTSDAVPVPGPQAGREQTKTGQVAPPPELLEQSVQKQALPLPPQKQPRTSNNAVLLVGIIAVLCICTAVALLLLAILRPTPVAQAIPTSPPVLAPTPVLPLPTTVPFWGATVAPASTSAPFQIATVAPAPTAAPTLPPPGLYVTAMGMDQAQPVHRQLINFTVSFLNTTDGDLTVKWRVYIYRADTPSKSNTDSAPVLATLHPGPTPDQPVPMNFKYGSSGNACDYFYARVDTVDSSNKPTGELTTTDGKVFQKDFAVCN